VQEGKGAGLADIFHQFPIGGSQLTSNVQAARRCSTLGLIADLPATIWGRFGVVTCYVPLAVWSISMARWGPSGAS
jgi:hypothetical protein